MAHDLVLKNGLIVTPSGPINGAVAVAGERIVGVGADETIGSARREIDLRGRIVMPGLFDPHVHFGVSDTFGDDAMATDFQYDSRDCLIGGVTTIATTTLMEAIHCSNFIRAQSGAAKRAAGATSRSPASLIRWTR